MSTGDKISSDELTDLIGRVRVSFGGFEDADALIAEAERFAARLAEVEAERDSAVMERDQLRSRLTRVKEQRDTWHTMWQEVRRELEAARPVVEAAVAYENRWRRYAGIQPGADSTEVRLAKAHAHQALLDAVRGAAVDLYRSATSDHPSTTEEKP